MDVDVRALTTYSIDEDGESVVLRLLDETGVERSLRFKIDDLGNLLMTLPGLIEAALQRRHGDAAFRFAYPIGSWSVEEAAEPSSLIVTLRTRDGFGVSFSMGQGHAKQLGRSIAAGVLGPRREAVTH
jgi:citrate lyase gamma subunit